MSTFNNTQYSSREVAKTIRDTALIFHISVGRNDVRIHKVMAGSRDIFKVIDRKLMQEVYEEFLFTYITQPA